MPDALPIVSSIVAATVAGAAAATAATPAPLTLASPGWFAAAAALAVVAVAAAVIRRIALPRGAMVLAAVGLASLCLAAGGLTWNRRATGRLAVVVDVSPSTTTATFRDPQQLAARLDRLLGDAPYTLYHLADGVTRASAKSLDDLPPYVHARQTRYAPPPAADAVVLLTDAQFAAPPPPPSPARADGSREAAANVTAPAAPQTFVVADPALERPRDGAVERLEVRGGDTLVATVVNEGDAPRYVRLYGTDAQRVEVPPGRFVVTGTLLPGTREAFAHLGVGGVGGGVGVGGGGGGGGGGGADDAWPANDELAIRVPPPPGAAQKWWIGRGPPPPPSAGWLHLAPGDLPADLADYLAPRVIVLDNVAADAIPETPRARLRQYARDLGGGVVILGGDRAFAAGGYAGSTLEELSPLASTPPRPAAQWLVLVDSSGSMARTLGDNARWDFAVDAVRRVVPLLPADDTLGVGNFAQGLRWWVAGRPVREVRAAGLPLPKDLRPHGPTNLAGALRLVADTADAALPTQLLLVTDAEARVDDAAALADALAAKRVRVSVLATTAAAVPAAAVPAADDPLRTIAARTGGRVVAEGDPRQWARELKELLRAASPPWLGAGAMTVHFTDAGPRLAPQRAAPWNRTWLKRDATELAVGEVAGAAGAGDTTAGGADAAGAERVPAVAAWNVGAGAVIAAAFRPAPLVVDALVERVAAPPRDPRFRVTYDAGRDLRVTVDAFDGGTGRYLNDLVPRLELSPDATRAGAESVPIPQAAPGRYAASIPAPLRHTIATVRLNGRVLDRFAVAPRYAPEFEAIGNDRAAMESLARATGGAVIEPANASRIDFRWPPRPVRLAPYLAAAGAAFVAAGLVRWRWA